MSVLPDSFTPYPGGQRHAPRREQKGVVRPQARWKLTHAQLRAGLAAVLGAGMALVLGRPDLVVAVAPLALIAAWGAAARPASSLAGAWPAAELRLATQRPVEGEQDTATVAFTGLQGAETVSATLASQPWVEHRPEHRARTVLLSPRGQETAKLTFGADPIRWGVHAAGPALTSAFGPWGAHIWGPVHLSEQTMYALPAPAAFDTAAPAPHPKGLVGHHRSARPGEGSEFNTLRGFQWGDRLKRINWARTSRTGQLSVTSSYADQDTHIALLVDAQAELGESEGMRGRSSSLDRAVRAAGALSEHFARQGDRVSLQTISGHSRRRVLPGTGRRHARRILETLARTTPGAERSPDIRRLRLGLTPGTIAVVVSAFVSPSMITRAATLASSGITVLGIDVLGEDDAPPQRENETDELAWRLRLLERESELRRLQQRGVMVVPWRGPGSIDVVLRHLARRGPVGGGPVGAGR